MFFGTFSLPSAARGCLAGRSEAAFGRKIQPAAQAFVALWILSVVIPGRPEGPNPESS
jgi:hypothetical protein